MSSADVSPYFHPEHDVLLIVSLSVLIVVLLTRGKRGARKDAGAEQVGLDAKANDRVHPGIDPAEYADVAEQQTALERLCELPQFRRLTDATLIDWGSGARITQCDCRLPPDPHLMISWGPQRSQGIVTKQALAHYVAYQERVANALLTGLTARVTRHAGAAGANSRGFPQPRKGR